jgi:hypothetical protein
MRVIQARALNITSWKDTTQRANITKETLSYSELPRHRVVPPHDFYFMAMADKPLKMKLDEITFYSVRALNIHG